MANGKISVIIPVFRTEKYLEKCIRSVLSQSYTDLEIITVDDGSDDGSPEMCDRFSREDSRIRVIHKENGGLSSARNAGLSAATGDYIAFVDSDDYIEKDMLKNLIENIDGADISVCGCYLVKDGRIKGQTGFSEKTVLEKKEALRELFKDERMKNYVCDKLFRKEIFSEVKFPDVQKFEDIRTTYRLFEKAENVNCIAYAGYRYIYREGALSKQKDSETCFSRFWAHCVRYEDISKRIPEYDGILLRQLFIQARAYMLSHPDENSTHTAIVTGFFLKNKEKITSLGELCFFEKKQASAIMKKNIPAIKIFEIFRKAQKLFRQVLKGAEK